MLTSLVLLLLPVLAAASRGASAYRGGYGDVEESAQQFKRGIQRQFKDTAAKASNIHLFFSLHDYNHDGHLDGHELRIAFTEFETKDGKQITLQEVEKMIDEALEKDDRNGDGLIGWAEYLESQKEAGVQ